jgi:hypothetical protein
MAGAMATLSTVKLAQAGKMADQIARQIVETEQYWTALCAEKLQTNVSSRGVLGNLLVTESVVLPSFEGVAECPHIKAFPSLTCLRNIT